ncbi:DNA topoisomerase IB [Microbacterium aerolatum]|uniref:DNA topoisomerase IB n=1 Tax=Microbacterium aerolatum TaxID=153731 RepID=UPI002000F5D5|nr:DNA topoisomerase IB [Microbacterium aerolatum]MCK3768303.1 DNA topoisomerase IB [Microbacterium aerolatum]
MTPRARRLPITREFVDDETVYRDGRRRITSKREIARIDSLAIPPAWTEVGISRSSSTKVLAKGVDDAGRTQTIYSPAFRRRQEKAKFARILRFAERLPRLRIQVEKDLRRRRLSEDKVVACVVRLIDQEFFRVGNTEYARKHGHYGVTTLRRKHTEVSGSKVTFDFVGKSGRRHVKTVRDPQLVRVISQLEEMPGYDIFRFFDEDGIIHDVDSKRVNAYVKRHMGEEFSAKDFRTWGGTLLATSALLAMETDDDAEDTAVVREVVAHVAERLGNTPAVTKDSYIDPRVFSAFEDGVTIPQVRGAMSRMRPRKHLTVEEQCVLKVLSRR